MPQTNRKSQLVCLSRPFIRILAFGANFGPLRAKISQIAWGTPTFYWPSRLYLPIGIQKYPYFCWSIFFHFGLGSKSQGRPVSIGTLIILSTIALIWDFQSFFTFNLTRNVDMSLSFKVLILLLKIPFTTEAVVIGTVNHILFKFLHPLFTLLSHFFWSLSFLLKMYFILLCEFSSSLFYAYLVLLFS